MPAFSTMMLSHERLNLSSPCQADASAERRSSGAGVAPSLGSTDGGISTRTGGADSGAIAMQEQPYEGGGRSSCCAWVALV